MNCVRETRYGLPVIGVRAEDVQKPTLSESVNILKALALAVVANLRSFATRFTSPESALLAVAEHGAEDRGFETTFAPANLLSRQTTRQAIELLSVGF